MLEDDTQIDHSCFFIVSKLFFVDDCRPAVTREGRRTDQPICPNSLLPYNDLVHSWISFYPPASSSIEFYPIIHIYLFQGGPMREFSVSPSRHRAYFIIFVAVLCLSLAICDSLRISKLFLDRIGWASSKGPSSRTIIRNEIRAVCVFPSEIPSLQSINLVSNDPPALQQIL